MFDVFNVILATLTVCISVFLIAYPGFLTQSIDLANSGNGSLHVWPDAYRIYNLYFNLAFALTFIRLFFRIRGSKSVYKKQFIAILIGTGITAGVSSVTNLVMPSLGNTDLIWAGPSASIFYVLAVAISIIRYGLFDIRFAVLRTFAYVFSLITLSIVYFTLAYVMSIAFLKEQAANSFGANIINILLALILAFIFQPVKRFFDKITNNIFYRNRYHSDEFYSRLSEVLTTTSDLSAMLKSASNEIKSILRVQQTFFIIAEGGEKYLIAGTPKHATIPAKDVHELNTYIEQNGDDIIVGSTLNHQDRRLKRLLASHRVELIVPLVRSGAIIGYLMLGEHLSYGFTHRDLRVLSTSTDELIIAIQNALSVQQVKDINASLEQRIETATAELRRSNARLKRLDETKDEFLSMASHQLRTPLTSIKGYLSMMLEGDIGATTPMQDKVLGEAYSSSERMVHLIHDFLNVSRLQTGKFMLELEDVNIVKLVEQEVKSLGRVAQSRDMKIEFSNKVGALNMTIDDNKIRQVVMNYIDNAIYYSHPETTIHVELQKKAGELILKVKDTGIGVPLSEQAHLFGKFYRATNARKQRPDGTGVGIYLAKKVIVAHGGDVVFESKPGKGSMFGFRLPLDQTALLAKKDNVHKKV